MSEVVRVLIADDHPIVRQGMELVLGTQPDLELVAKAANGEQAVQLAQQTQPDVIIMDLQMPKKDGLTAIQEIKASGYNVQILVLSSFPDNEKVFAAIKAGAAGFQLKDSSPEQLIKAIHMVHRGEGSLHPTIARKIMEEIRRPSPLPIVGNPLTERELDVLKCLAQGLSNREIALHLSISVRTVTTHIRNILEKLHLANRTQAALYAVEKGIAT